MKAHLSIAVILLCAVVALSQKHGHGHHKRPFQRMPHRPHGDVHVKLEEMGNAQNETIAIDVNRDENGADGSETKLQVAM